MEEGVQKAFDVVWRNNPVMKWMYPEKKPTQVPWRWNPKCLDDDGWDEQGCDKIYNQVRATCQKIQQHFKPENARMLLIGQNSAGKSSVINTMNAAVTKTYTAVAATARARGQATRQYKEYSIMTDEIDITDQTDKTDQEEKWKLPIKVCDFRGFGSAEHGASDYNIMQGILGLIKHGSEIMPDARPPEETEKEVQSLSIADLVILVVDGTLVDGFGADEDETQGSYKHLKKAIDTALNYGVPCALIITKCDKIDPEVKTDLSRIHYSALIKKVVDKAEEKLGITANRIFPVKNYVEEQEWSPGFAIQILIPLHFLMLDLYQWLKQRHPEETEEN